VKCDHATAVLTVTETSVRVDRIVGDMLIPGRHKSFKTIIKQCCVCGRSCERNLTRDTWTRWR
jgi:hypothetical protein